MKRPTSKKKKKNTIPPFVRSGFFIVGVLFIVWVFFFDKSSVITQLKLQRTYNELKQEQDFYEKEIEVVKKEHEALLTDEETKEKYARERYMMKKSNEDVFVIIEEE